MTQICLVEELIQKHEQLSLILQMLPYLLSKNMIVFIEMDNGSLFIFHSEIHTN